MQQREKRTPKPAIPKASLKKNKSSNPFMHTALLTIRISAPSRAQLNPAIMPYWGSIIVFTVLLNVEMRELKEAPIFAIAVL